MTLIADLLNTRLASLILSQAAGWIHPVGPEEADMLAFVLPRTAHIATIRLGCEISCHKHDEAVGAGNCHLFRLTSPMEERLNQALKTTFSSLSMENKEAALDFLTRLTDGVAVDSQPGPVRIGLLSDLTEQPADTIACVAKHYLLAYQQGYQTFPYFS